MAYTFTPATYFTPFRVESGVEADERLLRFYDGIPTPYVVIITSGVATTSPGDVAPTIEALAAADAGSGRGGKAIFVGGTTYTVTAGEHTILEAAGYTVSGP